jgi:hypothetical protein
MKIDLKATPKPKSTKTVVATKAKAPKAKKATAKAATLGFPPAANPRHKATVTRVVPGKPTRKVAKARVAAGKGT